jgi:tetratricopeptide (TPR) repeat protein
MVGDLAASYLNQLPADQQAELTQVNTPGLAALREYLASDEAVAFLGAGASAPLYPLWGALISELVGAAKDRLSPAEVSTCEALAASSPDAVVEIVRRSLGTGVFREVLRQVLRARSDPVTGRSWTDVQELVCRCTFKAVVTTNYDPGIVNARMRVRPGASGTGFATWEDELALDRWRTRDVFGEDELPVLFAHGQQNRPDTVVLATTEYRRAYAGKLPHVLARLLDGHVCWIGFSFADQRITAILREIGERTGTRADPGAAPRHVAVMPWNPAGTGNDPQILAQRAEIEYGAQVILYPAPDGDHSALAGLLDALTDARFPAAVTVPARPAPAPTPEPTSGTLANRRDAAVRWVPQPDPVEHFTGRTEELARLDRWAADPQVALIGITAWGGAGKTALVTRWVQEGGAASRPGLRGVFGWSFYADPSAEHWAEELLQWAHEQLGFSVVGTGRVAAAVKVLLRAAPLLLVLDGLERVQEGPAGDGFGRLLDGALREVLADVCQQSSGGLVVLTSRFPFADLETYDGASARMLEVPPFTPAEGSHLLAAAGGTWLAETERQGLVAAVDGHALAVGVLAGLLADRPPAADLAALRADLAEQARTDGRVAKVLQFYSGRLAEPDRHLLAAVSLFARPVSADAVLAVAAHEAFGSRLDNWTPAMVQAAACGRLAGLASWHVDGTISAHPLVRDSFRPLVMDAAGTAADTALAGMPAGTVASRADALRVVEVIELLVDAEQWQPGNDLYQTRFDYGEVWKHLPAARLGQRAAAAFVATGARRDACATHLTTDDLDFYLNAVGMFAMQAGDMATAHDYLSMVVRQAHDERDTNRLLNLAECLGQTGQILAAQEAAAEALTCAEAAEDRSEICAAHDWIAWLAGLVGDAAQAEQQFVAGDRIGFSDDSDGDHLYSILGTRWADWLARTGRAGPARTLTDRNAQVCRSRGWNEDMARCKQVLGRLALAGGDTATGGEHLATAAAVFRDGDYLIELADTLASLAEHARTAGDLAAAERHAAEAITIAAPRGLVLAQCAALAARACVRATQATTSGNRNLLYQGRDAADSALRLATRHQLAWHELDALNAHAALDEAEGTDHGWAAQADTLHARLVPPGLDPDPLATVERLIASKKKRPATRRGRKD